MHDGFQQTFSRTADAILKSVRQALVDKKVNNVLVVGHSLGNVKTWCVNAGIALSGKLRRCGRDDGCDDAQEES